MFEGYESLMGSLGLGDLFGGNEIGATVGDTGLGDIANIDGAMSGATDLYGSLGKDVAPALSPVAEIPGVGSADIFGGEWDGSGRMAELNGMSDMMAQRPGMDPSLSTTDVMPGSDMYGMLSRGTKGVSGLMGMYNSWQMMNIMNKNEKRNQEGFDLANQRYDTNHANVKNAFAV